MYSFWQYQLESNCYFAAILMLSLTGPVGYECINALLVPPFPSHECLPFPSPYLRWPIKCGYFLVTVMWTQHCGVVWLLCNRVIPSSTALPSYVHSPSSSLSESTVISSSSFQYSTVVQIPLHPLLHLSSQRRHHKLHASAVPSTPFS